MGSDESTLITLLLLTVEVEVKKGQEESRDFLALYSVEQRPLDSYLLCDLIKEWSPSLEKAS